jgi:hypothetical protein
LGAKGPDRGCGRALRIRDGEV